MSREIQETSVIPEAPPLAPMMPSYKLPRIRSKAACLESVVRMRQKELQFKMVGAIEGRDLEKVKNITESGVDVNAAILYTKTPLTYALELGFSDIAIYLLHNGADPSKPLNTKAHQSPIHLAVSHNSCEVLQKLLNSGVNVNTEDGAKMTPLHYASYYGCVEAFDELVSSGAIIDPKDMSGKTPFHRAVEERHILIAEKLLKFGANINEPDSFGWPPIFHAVIFNDLEIVEFLLMNQCDVNLRDLKGNSVLLMSCNRFKLESMKIMARTSFDYYKRTKMIPTEHQAGILYRKTTVNIDMINAIVNAGADVDAMNDAGERPIYHAAYACERDVVELLVSSGAWIDLDWLHAVEQSDDVSEERSLIHHWLVDQHEFQFPLVNQCRRAIRKFLTQSKNINIVQSIHKLPLPETMQKFLQVT